MVLENQFSTWNWSVNTAHCTISVVACSWEKFKSKLKSNSRLRFQHGFQNNKVLFKKLTGANFECDTSFLECYIRFTKVALKAMDYNFENWLFSNLDSLRKWLAHFYRRNLKIVSIVRIKDLSSWKKIIDQMKVSLWIGHALWKWGITWKVEITTTKLLSPLSVSATAGSIRSRNPSGTQRRNPSKPRSSGTGC